jgi:hypothetical protein
MLSPSSHCAAGQNEGFAPKGGTNQLDLGVVAKGDLVVVLGRVELLLRYLDAGLGDEVDLVLLEHLVELVDRLVEARRADLARLIHEGD